MILWMKILLEKLGEEAEQGIQTLGGGYDTKPCSLCLEYERFLQILSLPIA